jgi:hypothetical protein
MATNSQSPRATREGKQPFHHNSPVRLGQYNGPSHGQGKGQPDPFRHLTSK